MVQLWGALAFSSAYVWGAVPVINLLPVIRSNTIAPSIISISKHHVRSCSTESESEPQLHLSITQQNDIAILSLFRATIVPWLLKTCWSITPFATNATIAVVEYSLAT